MQENSVEICMIGSRLKEERERLGCTQPFFAELASAKKRTLIDWEKGVSSPTAVQLAALAKFGVDALYILTGVRSGDVAELNPAAAVAATLSVEPNGDGPLTKKLIESVANFADIKAARSQDVSDINKMLNGLHDEDFEILKRVIVRFYTGSIN